MTQPVATRGTPPALNNQGWAAQPQFTDLIRDMLEWQNTHAATGPIPVTTFGVEE